MTRRRSIQRATVPFFFIVRGALVGATLLATAGAGRAESHPAWFNRPYDYVVVNQDLRAVLTEFARNLKLPIAFSSGVQGRLRGKIKGERAGPFLDQVANANGLTWYFDGTVLHIGLSSEVTTRVIEVGGLDKRSIVAEMRSLGIADERFPVRFSPDSRFVTVSGPPDYVGAAEQLIAMMEPPAVAEIDDPVVRVFRGGVTTEAVAAAQKPAETAK